MENIDNMNPLLRALAERYLVLQNKNTATAQRSGFFIAPRLIQKAMEGKYISVTGSSIVDFKFSEQFSVAIEQKVTAEQNAQKAQNDLERVKFEAQQKIEQAKAEAESIRIQARAINSQGGADYVQLQAISKWNGILPTQFVPGSAVPFLNLIK